MTTWVVPDGAWQEDRATEGDYLLRSQDDTVVVARVGAGGAQWLGPLPAGAIDVQPVEELAERPDLTEAVAPLAMALAELGG